MNDEVENLLQRLAPRGPDAPLRERIQKVVESELARPSRTRRERRVGWSAAAAVLLGIALNYAAIHADNERRARYGPPVPASVQEMARSVESASDRETGQWVIQQFQQAQRPPHYSGVPAFENNLHYIWRELKHAQIEKDPQVPGPNRHGTGGAGIDRQRISGVAIRQTFGGATEPVARSRRAALVG